MWLSDEVRVENLCAKEDRTRHPKLLTFDTPVMVPRRSSQAIYFLEVLDDPILFPCFVHSSLISIVPSCSGRWTTGEQWMCCHGWRQLWALHWPRFRGKPTGDWYLISAKLNCFSSSASAIMFSKKLWNPGRSQELQKKRSHLDTTHKHHKLLWSVDAIRQIVQLQSWVVAPTFLMKHS